MFGTTAFIAYWVVQTAQFYQICYFFQFGKPGWKFNKKRVRVLTAEEIPEKAKSVVYWMSRDQRVQGIYFLFVFGLSITRFASV